MISQSATETQQNQSCGFIEKHTDPRQTGGWRWLRSIKSSSWSFSWFLWAARTHLPPAQVSNLLSSHYPQPQRLPFKSIKTVTLEHTIHNRQEGVRNSSFEKRTKKNLLSFPCIPFYLSEETLRPN